MMMPVLLMLFAFLRIACLSLMFCLKRRMLDIEMGEIMAYFFLEGCFGLSIHRVVYDQVRGEGIDSSADGPDMYMVYVAHTADLFDHFFDLVYIYIYRHTIEREAEAIAQQPPCDAYYDTSYDEAEYGIYPKHPRVVYDHTAYHEGQ